jgi:hypothetical protein
VTEKTSRLLWVLKFPRTSWLDPPILFPSLLNPKMKMGATLMATMLLLSHPTFSLLVPARRPKYLVLLFRDLTAKAKITIEVDMEMTRMRTRRMM